MPGTEIGESLALVTDVLAELPHLPELPARGPGSDLVGRGTGLLVDLHVDLQPSGWRLVPRPGRDEQRTRSRLGADLDDLEEATQGLTGPLKVQVAGPWTLAAALSTERGGQVLADTGACRDLAASLAEGVGAHVADLRRRVPGAQLLVQVDEPSLPTVLAGSLPTPSGLGRVAAVEWSAARAGLAEVLGAVERAGAVPLLHCCAGDVPLDLVAEAGAQAVSLDLTLLVDADEERLGTWVESGRVVLAGVVPAAPVRAADLSDPGATVDVVRRWWRRLGQPAEGLATQVVLTPTCGLAGATPERAGAVLRHLVRAGRVLVDDPEG
jgi:methionine synthase II (cobalamin-independent)